MDDETEISGLPQYLSAEEMHQRHWYAGMHPQVHVDDSQWDVKGDDDDYGVYINDGDKLIGFLRGQCPICGRRNLSLTNGFTFVRGAHHWEWETDEKENKIQNETLEMFENNGAKPIRCSHRYYVGVASRKAVEEYNEWKETRRERRKFESKVKNLREMSYIDDLIGSGYPKGAYLAAIYEELDCEEYDARDLMGRDSITKGQLATLLTRLKTLEVRNRPSLHEDDWAVYREFGITNGSVQWHVPEWVDFEGLIYDRSEVELFG